MKLATIVEIFVAVAFSFWLQTLHRRIDAFVERVFFARRYRAHAALEQIIDALPHTSSLASIDEMLVRDVAGLLDLASAALFRREADEFVRTTSAGGSHLPERLGADHPLVLYARSSGRLVHAESMPRASDAQDVARVVPLVSAQRVYGVAMYGEHISGEPIDGQEDRLLARLGQAAAGAYEHHALLAAETELARRRQDNVSA